MKPKKILNHFDKGNHKIVLTDSHAEQEKQKRAELRAAVEKHDIFVSKSASEFIDEALAMPDPIPLYLTLWHQGEISFLIGDTGAGKSLKAILIALKIAIHQVVLYADFELAAKVFQLRSTNKDSGKTFQYPDNFKRLEYADWNNIPDGRNATDWIIETLKMHMERHKCKVLIVDNITYLGAQVGDAKDATPLLKALKEWQRGTRKTDKDMGISLLILAHCRQRKPYSPIEKDDMFGSSRQMNFCDSAFAIGESKKDKNWRYIKQLKERLTEKTYGANNVILYTLTPQDNGLLDMVFDKHVSEADHTEERMSLSQEESSAKWKEAWEQRQLIDEDGKPSSFKYIGELFGYSHPTAMSYVKQYQAILDKEKEEKSKYKL
jgi:hypothetical protein